MMTIRIAINAHQIHRIEVVNHGPVGGPNDSGGLRSYHWTCKDLSGDVLHYRSEGAPALAAAVCDDLAVELERDALVAALSREDPKP